MVGRRTFVTRVLPLGALGLAAACGRAASSGPVRRDPRLALVYRGPASCGGCAEAVAALLQSAPTPFHTEFCGPGERVKITDESLASASLYAQPGGGNNLKLAWSQMRPYAETISHWVRAGGHYLGFCLGGYLAGFDPGFGLLPGDSGEYTASKGATVHSIRDTTVTLHWHGLDREVYFQDGPYFTLRPDSGGTVLATYTNGLAAAVVAPCGKGTVGVVGPHPEADRSWFTDAGLPDAGGVQFAIGYDLIERTIRA